MKSIPKVFCFAYIVVTISSSLNELPFTINETNRIKIEVENNPVIFSKINPFDENLAYVLKQKDVRNAFDSILYIVSFKTKTAEQVVLPELQLLDANLNLFWVKEYIVLFDSSNYIYYYWNNSAQTPQRIPLKEGYYSLIINPFIPHMFVATTTQRSVPPQISKDLGKTYISFSQGCSEFIWIRETGLLVFIQSENKNGKNVKTLYIRDFLNPLNTDILIRPNLVDFKVVDRYTLFITQSSENSAFTYYMYDATLFKLSPLPITVNYQNPTIQSIFYDKNFIFVILKDANKVCILRSHWRDLKFYSLICGVEELNSLSLCPFTFSNKPHVIYAQVYNTKLKIFETLYSKDDGDNWKRLKIQVYENFKWVEHTNIKLNLECNAKRIDNGNSAKFEIFWGATDVGPEKRWANFYSNEIGVVKTFEFSINKIVTLNHDELLVVIPEQTQIIDVYYKKKDVYEKIILQNIEFMLPIQNLVNQRFSTIVSLQIKNEKIPESSITSKTFLNIVFFEFEAPLNSLCDDLDYIETDICKKAQMLRYMKKKDDSICFTPVAFKFVRDLGQCQCSFDESFCKIQYKYENGYCTTKSIVVGSSPVCNNGKIKLSHMNGIRKTLDDKCEYDFSKDDDPEEKTCGYFDDPNFVKIVLNRRSISVYMDQNGKHFLRPITSIETDRPNLVISKIWDYEVDSDVIFYAQGNIVSRVENVNINHNGFKSNEIFSVEHNITGIIYDKLSDSIFISDTTFNIYQISIKSNNKIQYPINGSIVSFNKNIRTLSYITQSNQVCTQIIYKNSKCITTKEPIVNAYLDYETETAFILYQNKSLIIQKGITNYQIVTKILDVSFVRVIERGLYFVSNKNLCFINFKYPSVYYKIFDIPISHVIMLFERDSHKKTYSSLNCDYIEEVSNEFEGKCVCPTGSIQKSNKCESQNNKEYLKSVCLGFFCQNEKCIRSNTRCDTVDDCGDSSDEADCNKKCRVSKHLCYDDCLPKSKICFVINPKSENISKIKILIISLLVIFGVCGITFLGFIIYKKIQLRKLQRHISRNVYVYNR